MEEKTGKNNKKVPLQFYKSKTKRRDKSFYVYIKTFGCQMNSYDSEILSNLLKLRGFEIVSDLDSAQIALFNTCSVREHAEKRVYGKVGMLSPQICPLGKSKRGDNHPNKKIIGVIGCMAQAHKEKILKELPHVDLICGPQDIYNIPDYLEDIISGKKKNIISVGDSERPSDRENHLLRGNAKRLKAFVTIIEGCNNFCSYCIVPFVRGREKSRPSSLIIKEIKCLLEKGAKEITLLGQNVNSYGKDFKDGYGFVDLLKDIDALDNSMRLRFVTNHPKDTSEDLFKVMKELPSVCEHLHLPVQSGSDRILKSMNRNYTKKDYLKKIELLRKWIPNCSISTDIIVGYPSEGNDDFKETKDVMKEASFSGAYIFKYSPRPLTLATKLKNDVPIEIKEERNRELLELQREIASSNNKKLLGKEVDVLVEGVSRKGEGFLVGRSRCERVVTFKGSKDIIGKTVKIKIKDTRTSGLKGELKI